MAGLTEGCPVAAGTTGQAMPNSDGGAPPFFTVTSCDKGCTGPRTGELLGVSTPACTVLTSRGFATHLRPELAAEVLEGERQLFQVPVCDLVVRSAVIEASQREGRGDGLSAFWPHLREQISYCSFRNPRQKASVFGGDAVCSVETLQGRKKVGPKDLLELQKKAKARIVCAPAEEVDASAVGQRRIQRSTKKAAEWLQEMVDRKDDDPDLNSFDWHLLAGVQGGSDVTARQSACKDAAAHPVAGFWVGGLGYEETMSVRSEVLGAVDSALPRERPRFLALNSGCPLEVLHAVLHGVDVLELSYPARIVDDGLALTFSWAMPPLEGEAGELSPENDSALSELMGAASGGAKLPSVRTLEVRAEQNRTDQSPISDDSPTKDYSRAYLHHLFGVHELLGIMLVTKHNTYVYREFLRAIREHIARGTFRQFAAWFMRTQTVETRTTVAEPAVKRRKFTSSGPGGSP